MPPSNLVRLIPWIYRGAQRKVLDGGPGETATFPVQTPAKLIVEINALGGEVRFAINAVATATSAGRIPEDQSRIIGPLQNWESLGLYGAAGVEALILYFSDDISQ